MGKTKDNNTSLPTLSVLIANYNYARFIGEAFESVLSQSYKPLEIVVIDNASTDNSAEVIQKFIEREPNIRFIRNEKNMGVQHQFNQFLDMAKGEYFYFLGADEKLLPGFFEKSMKLLARYPEAGICSTLSYQIDEKGRNMGYFVTPFLSTKEGFILPKKAVELAKKNWGGWVPGNTVIYKRKIFDEVGVLNPELGPAADSISNIIIACTYGMCFIPEALGGRRVVANSYTERVQQNPIALEKIQQGMKKFTLANDILKKLVTPVAAKHVDAVFSYMINSLKLSQLQDKEIEFLKENMPPKRFLEKMLYVLIKFIAKFEKIIYHLYAFAHSERRIWPVIYNKLFRSLHFRLLYFVSKMRRKMSR